MRDERCVPGIMAGLIPALIVRCAGGARVADSSMGVTPGQVPQKIASFPSIIPFPRISFGRPVIGTNGTETGAVTQFAAAPQAGFNNQQLAASPQAGFGPQQYGAVPQAGYVNGQYGVAVQPGFGNRQQAWPVNRTQPVGNTTNVTAQYASQPSVTQFGQPTGYYQAAPWQAGPTTQYGANTQPQATGYGYSPVPTPGTMMGNGYPTWTPRNAGCSSAACRAAGGG